VRCVARLCWREALQKQGYQIRMLALRWRRGVRGVDGASRRAYAGFIMMASCERYDQRWEKFLPIFLMVYH
jgi:hypothetical protein